MATSVIMPKFGMTQEDATVVRWLRQENDLVEQGEPLLEVETDKTLMEVEAPADGILAGISAQPGQVVPVTTVIAYILAPGEELPRADATAEGGEATGLHRATPLAERRAVEAGIDICEVPPGEVGGRVTREDVERHLAGQSATSSSRLRATPAARYSARAGGLDLAGIVGSGPRGRIQAVDVQAARRAATPAAPLPGDVEVIPLAGMRRRIAERMQMSYQTAPHIMLTVDVDAGAMLALAGELSALAAAAGGPRVSITSILVKACAWALQRHRFVNATLHGEEIHLHRSANVGVAVALEEGLIVPVIRQAEALGVAEIASQLKDLVARARQGSLRPDDVSSGTFTISNLGMYGIRQFTAIINPPQAAILAVGRIAKRAEVVERETGDEIAIRSMMTMSLSVDHRLLDGAAGARFMQDLVLALEHPGAMLS